MALDDAKAWKRFRAIHHPEELSLPGSATRFIPRTLRKKTSDFLSPQAANRHMLRIPFVEEECT